MTSPALSAIIQNVPRNMREWRNRQTRTFEGRVVIPYGFKSRLSHQTGKIRTKFSKLEMGSDFLFFSDMIILVTELLNLPTPDQEKDKYNNMGQHRNQSVLPSACRKSSFRQAGRLSRMCLNFVFFRASLYKSTAAKKKTKNANAPKSSGFGAFY